ncbi:2-C-methyl-D-erythritol 4-phosphate cytidylyltransferase [Solwaraspora sp. WMMB335]|uniref:2-C-methyl-D-erythritol 4-phosphate cytidylyltransferase n=1 Tax=Solwaraspora sp. WMMB335 TaxID=3404118 RepID=UPI003B935B82
MTAHLQPRGDVAVLVPAAGAGVRLGPGAPKALRTLGGTPLLVHAVRRLAAAASVGVIVVAAPPADADAVEQLLASVVPAGPAGSYGPTVSYDPAVIVVPGGADRQSSVAAALAAVPAGPDIVLVHDAARALTPPALVESVAAAVRGGADAVIPVLPVVDTIKSVGPDGTVAGTVDRAVLRAVQTPQGFRRCVLAAAHAGAIDAHTDDAGLVERLGVPVHCVPGSDRALKITRPFDLVIAEHLLATESAGAGPATRTLHA